MNAEIITKVSIFLMTLSSSVFATRIIMKNLGKYPSISHMQHNKKTSSSLSVGFLFIGIFQFLLGVSLLISPQLNTLILWGAISFCISAIGILGMVLFKWSKQNPAHYPAHLTAAGMYFGASVIGWLLVSFGLGETVLILLNLLLVTLLPIGFLWERRTKGENYIYYTETLHVLSSYVWMWGLFLVI